LLESGHAYKCFCNEARLSLLRRNALKRQAKSSYDGKCRHLSEKAAQELINQGRPYVIRFKLEDKDVVYNDLTTGVHTSNPFNQEGDFVIIKSDRFPTYHFANVVDDHLMKISHVFRGQEWQLSTAKHILMYQAFGWQHPIYSHLPLLCNNDGSKISKRQNDIDVLSYRDKGYLPETILAYLCTIGGGVQVNILDRVSTFKDGSSVMQYLVENFDEHRMSSKMAKLNQELLENLNRKFIQLRSKSSDQDLLHQLKSLVQNKYTCSEKHMHVNEHYLSDEYLKKVLEWSQTRISKLNELVDNPDFAFLWSEIGQTGFKQANLLSSSLGYKQVLYLVKLLKEFLEKSTTNSSLFQDNKAFKKELGSLFEKLKVEENSEGAKTKVNYWQMTRIILTGCEKGPPVAEIFAVLEKDVLLDRLNSAERFINYLKVR
jgi:glutamyl-tRNA synthetase